MDDRQRQLDRAVELRERGDYDEACVALIAMTRHFPEDAEIFLQCAWAHDNAGYEAKALPYYDRALEHPGLDPEQRKEALLGAGSTYRVLGRTAEAVRLLERAVDEFPTDNALRVFLAMAHFDAGEQATAFAALLRMLIEVASDQSVQDYRRPIGEYAAQYAAHKDPC